MGARVWVLAVLAGFVSGCAGESVPPPATATSAAEVSVAEDCADCTAKRDAAEVAEERAPDAVARVAVADPAATRTIAVPAPPEDLGDDACYSVDLFDRVEIDPPPPGTPPGHARFLGFWGDGAWNGEWCHEMVVTRVTPEGRVDLIDMQAPSEKYDARATAFRRTGRIDEAGVLTLAHGPVERRYVLRDGTLHALREGPRGRLAAVLEREANAQVAMLDAAQAMQVSAADLGDRAGPVPVSAGAEPARGGDSADTGPAFETLAAAGAAIPGSAGATPAAGAESAAAPPETPGTDGSRVALVIGNTGYRDVPDLVNPRHDAADLARVLDTLGFSVTRLDDADFQAFRLGLRAFRDRAARAEVALIYYAGHGVEIERRNFMLPVDARLAALGDVSFEAIPLGLLENAAAPATRLSLVIVDACRNNPFLERLPATSRSVSRGLIAVEPVGRDRLVAFAAREGTVASDGRGRNSPYAEALMAALETPGLEIGKLFRRVHDRVRRATGGAQQPALYGALSAEDFYFRPPTVAGGA